ncbi:MAG: O-antigen ligase family protein [Candidatus Aminicenantales bacterium]
MARKYSILKNLPRDTAGLSGTSLILYLLFSMVSITASHIFLSLALIFWIVGRVRRREWPRFPSFFWPVLAFCGFSIIASLLSVNTEVSLLDSRDLLLFLIVPMTFAAFSAKKDLERAHLALLVSGSASALYALGYFLFVAQPGERISGFMGHWMTQAGLLLLFSCVSLSFFLLKKGRIRLIWGAAWVLAAVALALTLTRSAWVGGIVGTAVILALYKPRTLVILPVAGIIFFLLSPAYMKTRILSTFSTRSVSNAQRLEYLRAGIQIIKDYPLFGTGPDTVDMVFQNPKYGLSDLARRNVHLHNNITQIGAERGIPALVSWLVFMGWLFLSLVRILRNKDPGLYPLAVAGLAALFALTTAGMFEYNFGDSEITVLFLYLVTIPFAQLRSRSAEEKKG